MIFTKSHKLHILSYKFALYSLAYTYKKLGMLI